MKRTTKTLAERRSGEPPFKHKYGPPSEFRSWMCDKVIQMMSEGKIVSECCAALDISHKTFYTWLTNFDEFREAYDLGRPKLEAFWMQKYRESLQTTKDRTVHQALLIFATKNIIGWADKMEQRIKREESRITEQRTRIILDISLEKMLALRELCIDCRMKILDRYGRKEEGKRRHLRDSEPKEIVIEKKPEPEKEKRRRIKSMSADKSRQRRKDIKGTLI